MYIYFLLLVTPAAVLGLEVEPDVLKEFQSMFHEGIKQHMQGEYTVLMPIVARQNETWEMCKESMVNQRPTCRSCVEAECGMEHGNLVHENLQKFWYQLPSEASVNWEDWHRVGENVFGYVNPDMTPFDDIPAMGTRSYGGKPPVKKVLPLVAALPALLPSLATAQTALPFVMGGFTVGTKLIENWDGFTNTMNNIGNGIGNAMNGIGNGIGNAVNGIGNGVGDFFGAMLGRRRRDVRMSARLMQLLNNNRMDMLGDDTRQCMEQCTECMPFLGDVADFVSGECGERVLEDQRNMVMMIKELKVLYKVNGSPRRSPPILRKIEYNPDNFQLSSMSFGDVYITAMTPSGPVRYLSEFRFRLQWPETSAIEMVEELVAKWGL